MGKLRPLWTPGGRGSSRPPGLPTLNTDKLPNSAPFWDDFAFTSVGAALALGHHAWTYTAIAGTNTVGNGSGATTASSYLSIVTDTGASSGGIIDSGQRTTTTGGLFSAGATTGHAMGMWRAGFGGTSSNIRIGYGWVNASLAVGTNWLTDPDTTLATANALIVHQDYTGAYSGDTAGDVVARFYGNAGADNASILLEAGVVSGQHKFEAYWNGANQCLIYWDGVYKGVFASTSATAMRATAGIQSVSTSKTLNLDCTYAEQALTSPR